MKKQIIQLILLLGITRGAHGVLFAADGAIRFTTSPSFTLIRDTDQKTPLKDSNYRAQLYAGPKGTIEGNLKRVGPSAPFAPSLDDPSVGYINGTVFTIPGVAPKQTATVQVRAWKVSSGASWETAAIRGQSSLLNVVLGTVPSPPPPPPLPPPPPSDPPATLTLLQDFSLQAVGPFADNFADGNDDGWKHYDVLPAIGGKAATFEVKGGAYHIHAPASAVTSPANPPRAGGFLPDTVLTDFETAVDVLAWDDAAATEFGLLGRTRNLGLGKTDAYIFLCSPQRKQIGIYIGHGEAGYTLAVKNMTMDPTHQYRMVFSGVGELLTAKLTDLTDTSIPDVTLSARDSAY